MIGGVGEHGGMAPTMAKEMKAQQGKNARLKKVVANQALDMEILKNAYAKENGLATNADAGWLLRFVVRSVNYLFFECRAVGGTE